MKDQPNEYEKLLEARNEALVKKVQSLEAEVRQLRELVRVLLKNRPPVARDLEPNELPGSFL